MVWPYGLRSPVLISHAMTSERTEVATVPAGTLWDGTYDSKSSISSTELDYASTVSTNSTVHASTTHVPCLSSLHHLLNLVPFHHLNPNATIPRRSPSSSGTTEASRVCGFGLNENWQGDWEHYDNQKVNGLTFPRMIRSSAFTQKLDIEGCDPLALPVAALLYQQANNHWLRKLAHGREIYFIPTGDIAAVVFATELLSQLKNRGIDLDRVSQVRARQDGKTLDKTSNTKFAALRSTDPDSQHEITYLRSQLAELRERLGDDASDVSTPLRTGQQSFSSQTTPIQRALMGSGAPAPPPAFDPACLLIHLLTILRLSNNWLTDNLPTGLADCTFAKWLTDPLSPMPSAMLSFPTLPKLTWWSNQLADAVETVQKVAVMMGILPICQLQKNFNATNLIKVLTVAIRMTN